MMNPEMTKPATWQWLERELASRLRTPDSNRNDTGKPLAEFLDEKLRQGVSVKQSARKAVEGQKS